MVLYAPPMSAAVHTKFTSCIMFWTKVTKNVRHVMVAHLFLKDCRVSVTAYIEVLDTGDKPCIGSVDVRDHMDYVDPGMAA